MLRILLSIGGSETMHFQTWQDKAGNAPPLTEPTTGLEFPDLNADGELFQTNLIMPEPTIFLDRKFPVCSIIRPTETEGAAMRALEALTADGLFIGQSPEFFAFLRKLARAADKARRRHHEDDDEDDDEGTELLTSPRAAGPRLAARARVDERSVGHQRVGWPRPSSANQLRARSSARALVSSPSAGAARRRWSWPTPRFGIRSWRSAVARWLARMKHGSFLMSMCSSGPGRDHSWPRRRSTFEIVERARRSRFPQKPLRTPACERSISRALLPRRLPERAPTAPDAKQGEGGTAGRLKCPRNRGAGRVLHHDLPRFLT